MILVPLIIIELQLLEDCETWAALSGQGRDPQLVTLAQQEATNSLYR